MMRCFDIGGSKIVAADVTESGEIHEHARAPTPVSNFSDFGHTIKKLCPKNNSPISLSIAGAVHPVTGLVHSANIHCISGLELVNELAGILSRKVFLINDANAFTLAESRIGAAKGHPVTFGIILGTGVGGGIVINDTVLTGMDGSAGEWGHGTASTVRTGVKLPHTPCLCGCLRWRGGLERLYLHAHANTLSSVDIVNSWQSGCHQAATVIDTWLDIVGGALASAVNLIGPSIVPVGGGLANSQHLINALEHEVNERRLTKQRSPLLYSAISGPEQGLIGAAMHAMSYR